jgi:hypothetical protein
MYDSCEEEDEDNINNNYDNDKLMILWSDLNEQKRKSYMFRAKKLKQNEIALIQHFTRRF